MNLIQSILERRRKAQVNARLKASMKPDPEYRARRLRYLAGDPQRRRRFDLATREVENG